VDTLSDVVLRVNGIQTDEPQCWWRQVKICFTVGVLIQLQRADTVQRVNVETTRKTFQISVDYSDGNCSDFFALYNVFAKLKKKWVVSGLFARLINK